VRLLLPAVCALTLLGACASRQPYQFYILSVQPQGVTEARTTPATPVTLKVTLPSLVDRPEMILNTSADGVTVLEHERWAAPPADLATQTLARDLERRRLDVLVADSGTDRSGGSAIKITVDVVQMTVHRGDQASIEAHWRIFDPRSGKSVIGGDVFSAPLGQVGYAAVAQALSDCLGLLADRLVGQMVL
jgi:uncharacterized lipoprotein YmbA